MDQKHIDLIKRLIKSTKDKKVEWQKSSARWQYKLELKAASFVIDKYFDAELTCNPEDPATVYSLNMYNGENTEIRIAIASDFPVEDSDYQLLVQLYMEAEESCVRENETIAKVIEELDILDLPF